MCVHHTHQSVLNCVNHTGKFKTVESIKSSIAFSETYNSMLQLKLIP